LRDGRNRVLHLLSSVLSDEDLSDQAAVRLYKLRWGVEVLYRSLKQTLGRRKMLSDSPKHAQVELDWCVIGLWMLSLRHWPHKKKDKPPGDPKARTATETEVTLAAGLREQRTAA